MNCKEEHRPGVHVYRWEDTGLAITLQKYREHRDGRITSEVICRNEKNGAAPHIYHSGAMNLGSPRTKTEMARDMTERFPLADWPAIVEYVCVRTIATERKGEAAVPLDTDEYPTMPHYQAHPFLPMGKTAILFGLGGANKTFFALMLGLLVDAGQSALGIDVIKGNVLFLDWETDYEEIRYRSWLLRKGLGIPNSSITYRRCVTPFADDLMAIEKITVENAVSFIIVDSIAGAVGGDLQREEGALRFSAAFRQLGVTGLWVTHTQKNTEGKDRSAYGSAFFTNTARSVWEIRGAQEEGDGRKRVALFHRKVNMGKLQRPRGYQFEFADHAITVRQADVLQDPVLAEGASLQARLRSLLVHMPNLTIPDIAAELNLAGKDDTVRMTLNRNKHVFRSDGKSPSRWAVVEQQTG